MPKEPAINDDAENTPESADAERTSAAGATKRKSKSASTASAKESKSSDSKAAERARIERSKRIAEEARGGKSTKNGAAKKGGKSTESMTKEQLRYSSSSKRGTKVRDDLNPVWFKPIMFGFLLLGLVWILVYYLSSGRLPVAPLGDWNLLVGIGIAMVGFLMMTNWK